MSSGKTLAQFSELQARGSPPPTISYSFTEKINWQTKLWLLKLKYLADIFLKRLIKACHLKGNNRQDWFTNARIWTFNWRFQFHKTWFYHLEPKRFQHIQIFSIRLEVILAIVTKNLLYNAMCWHLEDICNLVTHYFLNNLCIILQNLVTEDPINSQGSLMHL